ncbi:MAG: RDD family protein [Thioalkalispiraceae bacterium]|jgi:uncharacterized RDD family membrane protein YckC
MSETPQLTSEEEKDIVYVGFWLRFAAAVIDSIAVLVIVIPLLLIIYDGNFLSIKVDPDLNQTLRNLVPDFGEFIIKYILPAVAIILFWVFKSATPGKMAIGAEIVDAKTLSKPSTRQLIIRYLGYYVSILPFMLGFIWAAFDHRKQAWHDKLAGTVVIQKR